MYDNFNRGDIPAVLGVIDDSVVFTILGSSNVPLTGTRRGLAGMQQFFSDLANTLQFSTFEPRDYIAWSPSPELLAWVKSRQQLANNQSFAAKQSPNPYYEEARRVFPGLSPADRVVVPGLPTTLDLGHAALGIRAIYQSLLNKAWSDAQGRGEKLPPISQKNVPPTVPGQQ